LLERVLGKFRPRHALGVFVHVQPENDAVVVVRNHVAGHRLAVGQRKRVRANGDKHSAKPETKKCPNDSAHGKSLTNANAPRKQICSSKRAGALLVDTPAEGRSIASHPEIRKMGMKTISLPGKNLHLKSTPRL